MTPAFVNIPGRAWFGGYGKDNVILYDPKGTIPRRKGPSENNKEMIDKLIQVAEKNVERRH